MFRDIMAKKYVWHIILYPTPLRLKYFATLSWQFCFKCYFGIVNFVLVYVRIVVRSVSGQ